MLVLRCRADRVDLLVRPFAWQRFPERSWRSCPCPNQLGGSLLVGMNRERPSRILVEPQPNGFLFIRSPGIVEENDGPRGKMRLQQREGGIAGKRPDSLGWSVDEEQVDRLVEVDLRQVVPLVVVAVDRIPDQWSGHD